MGAVEELIRRARRRQLANLLLKQAAGAVCAGMGGVVLLLLLGTQILDWPWLAAILVVSVAVGTAVSGRFLPSTYATAQEIDRRLELQDAISTAFYYSLPECRRNASEYIKSMQRGEAERLAQGADLQRAIPLVRPKSLYAMAVLLVVASSLFALRYAFTRSLDLRPPLATIVLDAFHFSSDQQLAAAHKPKPDRPDPVTQYGTALDSAGRKTGNQDGTPGTSSESAQSERSDRSRAGSKPDQGGSEQAEAGDGQQQQGSQSGQQGNASVERVNDRAGDSSGNSSRSNSDGQAAASQQAANSQHEGNSLVDKFRDAMANLLSRLKPQRSEPQQMASNSRPGRQDQGRRTATQNGNQSASRAGAKSQNGEPQGDEQGQGAEQAQSGPGREGGSDADQATKQGQSGIGRQDGSKDVREAEQLAAMGKISEIIGRRSQNLTGEVMVEVTSGKQELHTAYSQQKTGHKDSGGEIHRDEIPLAYQAFVQHYFDEVRKTAPRPKQP